VVALLTLRLHEVSTAGPAVKSVDVHEAFLLLSEVNDSNNKAALTEQRRNRRMFSVKSHLALWQCPRPPVAGVYFLRGR